VTANADVRFMELRNLTSFMTYRVTVTAHNHHGSSVPSEAIVFNMQGTLNGLMVTCGSV